MVIRRNDRERALSDPAIVAGIRAHVTVAVLALCYMVSFVDRQILGLLIEFIRADLGLTDTQISLVAGLAFAIFYTSAAVPLAMIADRWSRKGVIMAGVVIWGAMTSLCGLAASFTQLFLGRLGVGLGEAALTPSAYAIIADIYSGKTRARAMSIFVIGGAAGAGIAMMIGAGAVALAGQADRLNMPLLGEMSVWRVVMIGLGAFTMLLIFPLLLIISPPLMTQPALAKNGNTGDVVRDLWQHRRGFAALFLGIPLINMGGYGYNFSAPAMLIRNFGWAEVDVGLWLGGTQVVAGVLGVLCFGFLAQYWRRDASEDWLIKWIIWTTLPAAVLLGVAGFATNAPFAIGLLAGVAFLTGAMSALAPVALQAITLPDRRARVSSLFLLVANLVGIGLGPLAVSLGTDYGFGDANSVGMSMALVCGTALTLGSLVCIKFRGDYRSLSAQMLN
jgi:MFS family permease